MSDSTRIAELEAEMIRLTGRLCAERDALAEALDDLAHEYVTTADSPFACAGGLGVYPRRCAFPSNHRIHRTSARVRAEHGHGTEE